MAYKRPELVDTVFFYRKAFTEKISVKAIFALLVALQKFIINTETEILNIQKYCPIEILLVFIKTQHCIHGTL